MPLWAVNLVRPFVHYLSRLFFHVQFQGCENIPLTGPLIITPNHVTYVDPILISVPVRRRIYYMTWDKVFDIPVIASVATLFGAFPVRLNSADKSAVAKAKGCLTDQAAVMIFPEGGRSPDGRLQRFHIGAFRLAVNTQSALLPVTINGGFSVWPRHRRFPRPGHIRIVYHPPIFPAPISPPSPEAVREESRRLADKVRTKIVSGLDPGFLPSAQAEQKLEY